eukprot:7413927-Alexandrium_andersonii.AAC.1
MPRERIEALLPKVPSMDLRGLKGLKQQLQERRWYYTKKKPDENELAKVLQALETVADCMEQLQARHGEAADSLRRDLDEIVRVANRSRTSVDTMQMCMG